MNTLTQYNDYIDGSDLHWEGEEKHTSDKRVINAAKANNGIHLFYRDIHHSPFVYYGEIFLKKHKKLTSRPSQFLFSIGANEKLPDLIDDIASHKKKYKSLSKTEQESIVKSRIGQGIFRDRLIVLWGAVQLLVFAILSCCVLRILNHGDILQMKNA